MAEPRTVRQTSRDTKFLEDRVSATTEDLEQALDPDRTPRTVRFPDPAAPPLGAGERDIASEAPETMADVQMARRTDAGNYQAARDPSDRGQIRGLYVFGAGALILLAILIGVVVA